MHYWASGNKRQGAGPVLSLKRALPPEKRAGPQFGRGPTKTRTHYAGPDTLITTLENSLTPAERRMVEMDEHPRLRDIRMFFQCASEAEFVGAVEEITGRKVRAFISGIDTKTDVSCEVFYLEPRD